MISHQEGEQDSHAKGDGEANCPLRGWWQHAQHASMGSSGQWHGVINNKPTPAAGSMSIHASARRLTSCPLAYGTRVCI